MKNMKSRIIMHLIYFRIKIHIIFNYIIKLLKILFMGADLTTIENHNHFPRQLSAPYFNSFPTPLTLFLGKTDYFQYTYTDPQSWPVHSSYSGDCPCISSGPTAIDASTFQIDFSVPLLDFSLLGSHVCTIEICND